MVWQAKFIAILSLLFNSHYSLKIAKKNNALSKTLKELIINH